MRAKFDESRDPAEQRKQIEHDLRRCAAHGCPARASISLEGGRRCCSYHVFAEASRWPEITRLLRQHEWLIDLIGDLQRRWNAGKSAEARRMAVDFWAGDDDYMVPTATESALFPTYMLRLREELAYRVGVSVARPKPREPRPRVPGAASNLMLPELEEEPQ